VSALWLTKNNVPIPKITRFGLLYPFQETLETNYQRLPTRLGLVIHKCPILTEKEKSVSALWPRKKDIPTKILPVSKDFEETNQLPLPPILPGG
jgi:hypothetical protein